MLPAGEVVETVARRSYGKLVALLAMRTRDVASAEDALADAFAAALKSWPQSGCPDNPEAWLLTVARRRMVDMSRRDQRAAEMREIADAYAAPGATPIPDERLALLFACAHPALDRHTRTPLMLQVVLGLDAKRIASAFLASPAAMSKRLVRAKDKIRDARIPLRVPERTELPARLDAVLDAIYAAFSEGWSDVSSRDLTGEAIFLAELVVELLPDTPEALGLLSLMLYADARRGARRDAEGEFVPFAGQDSDRWDWALIARAESLLARATALHAPGRFQTEAALQSAHVFRRRTGIDNWADVVALYDALLALTASPVVAVNRALALAEVAGASHALASLDALSTDRRLSAYQPYWAAQAELLVRVADLPAARKAFEMAIGLEADPAVRRYLQKRAEAIAP